MLTRSVVVLELNEPHIGIEFLEVEKVLKRCALESKDRLLRVTDHKQVRTFPERGEQFNNTILSIVCILVLVHQNILVLFLEHQSKIFV